MNLIESGKDITPAGEVIILTGVAVGTALIYWGGEVAARWLVEKTYGAKFDAKKFAEDQSESVDDFIKNNS